MKRFLIFGNIIAVALFTLVACGSNTVQDTASKELGISVSGGKEVSNFNEYSGGEGRSCIAISFDDDTVLEEIKGNFEWKAFPLDDTMQALIYGLEDETGGTSGPFLSDNQQNALVPDIQNGYYILIDRHTEKDKATGADILNRGSFNFTVGLYDIDTNTLYSCKLDT